MGKIYLIHVNPLLPLIASGLRGVSLLMMIATSNTASSAGIILRGDDYFSPKDISCIIPSASPRLGMLKLALKVICEAPGDFG